LLLHNHAAMPNDGAFRATDKQPTRRLGGATGRGFMPGRSGNPGGRPKAVINVQELARQHTEQAVRALVEALRDPRHKVAAACALLDRAWGKPQISVHSEVSVNTLHLVAARLVSAELQLELGVPTAPQPNVIDLTALPPATE
jgi:hypothetical protein